MKKTSMVTGLFLVVGTAIIVQSCKKIDDEFVAEDASFTNFSSWVLQASLNGPDPALGSAHSGNDASVTRFIYFKDGQDTVGGVYPQGTIIVKRSTNTSGSIDEITAMVKRGGDFNTDNNGWEWFTLKSDGSIKSRGASLLSGVCGDCHSGAGSSKDYVFSK